MPVKYTNSTKKKGTRKSFFGDNAGAVAAITQNPDDPNTDPSAHIKDFSELEKIDSHIAVLPDVSGSNKCYGGRLMLEQLHRCNSIDTCVEVIIQPFGQEGPIIDYYTEEEISNEQYSWNNYQTKWKLCQQQLQDGLLDRDSYLMKHFKSFSLFNREYNIIDKFRYYTDT